MFRGSVLSKTLKGAGGHQAGGRLTPQGGGQGPLVGGEGAGQAQPGDEKWTKVLDLNRAGAAMNAETFTQVSCYSVGPNYSNYSTIRIVVYGIRIWSIFKTQIYSVFSIWCIFRSRIYSVIGQN